VRLSLQEIDRRIDALDEAPFQLLCERFLRLEHVDLFPRLTPRGRNSEARTTKGWPDGYRVGSTGQTLLFEATRSGRWPDHLDRDIAELKNQPVGSVSHFFFVAWAREPSLVDARDLVLAVVDAGVPAAGAHLIFRGELVERLSEPQFAALCFDTLRIPTSSEPFVLIETAPVFGSGLGAEFAPSLAEYRAGVVEMPAVRARVDAALARNGFAYVRGRGAAGKTTLAVQLALDARRDDRAAYFWDVSDQDGAGPLALSDVLDAFAIRAGPRVVFVLDNVHQKQRLSRSLYEHWRTLGRDSQLVFVGRETLRIPRDGRLPPLRDLESEDLLLQAGPAEVGGVLTRLARRAGLTLRLPADEALLGLTQEFGGDLIAFSAAMAPKLGPAVSSWPIVEPSDARRHVYQTYLAGLEPAARAELLLVSALSWLELGASDDIVSVPLLEASLAQGVVHEIVGTGSRRYLRTVHAGVGDLIGRAGSANRDHETALQDAVQRRPALASLIAERLVLLGADMLAYRLLCQVTRDDQILASYLTGRAGEKAEARYRQLTSRGLISRAKAEAALIIHVEKLAAVMPSAQLRHVVATLDWMKRRLPKAYDALCPLLAQDARVDKMAKAFATEPFDWLTLKLEAADRHVPSLLQTTMQQLVYSEHRWPAFARWIAIGTIGKRKLRLVNWLGSVDGGEGLLAQAFNRHGVELLGEDLPIHVLTRKRVAHWHIIGPLDAAARSASGRQALLARAGRSSKAFADIFEYASRFDAPLWRLMLADLAGSQSVSLKAHDMIRLLRRANHTSPELFEALLDVLLAPDAVTRHIAELCNSRPSNILTIHSMASGYSRGDEIVTAFGHYGLLTAFAERLQRENDARFTAVMVSPLGPVVAPFLTLPPAARRVDGPRPDPVPLGTLLARLRELGREDLASALSGGADA
jgi:hypothetical protein